MSPGPAVRAERKDEGGTNDKGEEDGEEALPQRLAPCGTGTGTTVVSAAWASACPRRAVAGRRGPCLFYGRGLVQERFSSGAASLY